MMQGLKLFALLCPLVVAANTVGAPDDETSVVQVKSSVAGPGPRNGDIPTIVELDVKIKDAHTDHNGASASTWLENGRAARTKEEESYGAAPAILWMRARASPAAMAAPASLTQTAMAASDREEQAQDLKKELLPISCVNGQWWTGHPDDYWTFEGVVQGDRTIPLFNVQAPDGKIVDGQGETMLVWTDSGNALWTQHSDRAQIWKEDGKLHWTDADGQTPTWSRKSGGTDSHCTAQATYAPQAGSSYVAPAVQTYTDPQYAQELPPGWEAKLNRSTGRNYYTHTATGVDQWERPTGETQAVRSQAPANVFQDESQNPGAGWTEHQTEAGIIFYCNDVSMNCDYPDQFSGPRASSAKVCPAGVCDSTKFQSQFQSLPLPLVPLVTTTFPQCCQVQTCYDEYNNNAGWPKPDEGTTWSERSGNGCTGRIAGQGPVNPDLKKEIIQECEACDAQCVDLKGKLERSRAPVRDQQAEVRACNRLEEACQHHCRKVHFHNIIHAIDTQPERKIMTAREMYGRQ